MALRQPPDKINPAEIGELIKQSHATETVHRFHCRLVTPLYGGGVETGEIDQAMPIRATAIRGQLRFWWRLITRNQYMNNGTLDHREQFKAERHIWGGLGDEDTLAASKVTVRVMNIKADKIEECCIYPKRDGRLMAYPGWKDWAHRYALFPAQGKVASGDLTTPPAKLLLGAEWEMELHTHELDEKALDSVMSALRWWASFGGIGARTRRGLGAVEVTRLPDRRLMHTALVDIAGQDGFELRLKAGSEKDALTAWKKSVEELQKFRQGKNVGRNAGSGNHPGRSFWPEPDAVRMITGKHSANHKPEHPAGKVFPRAAFGLPIIFHFKDDRDPADSELIPYDKKDELTRMASPIILRPYHHADGKWSPAALRLPDEHVWKMSLRLKKSGNGRNRNLLQDIPAEQWWLPEKGKLIKPMQKYSVKNPLQAFLESFGPVPVASSEPEPDGVVAVIGRSRTWVSAQIKYNSKINRLSATYHNVQAYCSGEDAQQVLKGLSDKMHKQIKDEKYTKLKAIVDGHKLLKLEESQ